MVDDLSLKPATALRTVWAIAQTNGGTALARVAKSAEVIDNHHTMSHTIRALILSILSGASVFGADMSVRVVTTSKTNAETTSVSTRDVFTRDGQTNLVRDTKTKAGAVQIRIHRFYHRGKLVGDFIAMQDSSGFTSEAGSPYSVTFEFWPTKEVRSAVIGTKDGVVLDAFACTNGTFTPVDSSVIRKANAVGADMKQLFDPEHVRKTSSKEFIRETERLIDKHKD